MKKILLTVLVAVTLSGCTSMPKVITALKNDPACVKFDVMAPGWGVHFERSFPTNWTQTVTK